MPQEQWVIGSAPDCDIVARHPVVSQHHCRVSQTSAGVVLEDLQSTNGTYVNGQRIAVPVLVRQTDVVTLGANLRMPWPDTVWRAAADGGARPQQAGELAAAVSPPATSDATTVTIGYDPDNDIVLAYPMVSSHHARLLMSAADVILEDLGSTNGTSIGSPHNRITRARLQPTDTVFLGTFRIPASRLLQGRLNMGDSVQETLEFRGSQMFLGRDATCDVVLDFPTISGRHAKLRKTQQQIVVEDLGSLNGTFVNGKRIHGPVPVGDGTMENGEEDEGDDMAIGYFPESERLGVFRSVFVLVMMLVMCVVGIHLILRFRDVH